MNQFQNQCRSGPAAGSSQPTASLALLRSRRSLGLPPPAPPALFLGFLKLVQCIPIFRVLKLVLLTFFIITLTACRQKPAGLPEVLDEVLGEEVILETTTQAEKLGFTGTKGVAVIDLFGGEIQVTLSLPDGIKWPENTAVEAWLVDAGTADDPSQSSASEADEKFGVGFGNAAIDQLFDRAPYALSLGGLKEEKGKWAGRFKFPGEFTPYDLVMVTLESDASIEDYDPRPGTVLLSGEIKGEDLEKDF